ncbi:glycoside hydrolase superfamily [Dissophora ornata]|nr:hypothetical protein BGZ58_008949 [Dissophora ornata]KAI8597456.1 glycoside hydrolase superfamily [Dissophora ornata]
MSSDNNNSWSSEDIYKALSELPLEVETSFTVETYQASPTKANIDPTHHAHASSHHHKQRILHNLTLLGNDRRAIDSSTGATSTSTAPIQLIITSTITPLPSSKSCIRTIELSVDTTSQSSLSSEDHSPVSISVESFCAGMKIPLVGKAFFANGYQSWSTSYAGADETSVFEKPNWLYNELTHLGLASDMHIYEYPGVKGKVHSNVVTLIRDKCVDSAASTPRMTGTRPEELVLCGSLSEDSGYTYFLMDTNQDRFVISQDCAGKQLRSSEDKLVLRTFFAWGNNDASVWDAYAAAWGSFHQDRRFVQSSLHNQQSGWTSWYCHYENINEHVILENLQHFSGSGHSRPEGHGGHGRSGWPAKVFQIDDGYTVVGDWLDPNKEKFPRGMSFIAESIRDKGLTPGLWLAPFLVSKKSKLSQEHPEWFVRSPNSELMLSHPFVSSYALDLENSEVRSHLANVFRVVTQEWGFRMLKLDFLFAAAQVARNGKTRGQLMWEAMQMVRTWAGPETILLGCGVPLGASFMVVDYCRIGCDVGASWDTMQRHFHDREYISCFNSLTSTLSRWAFSGRFFGNDPDVFFIRDWNMGLNAAEKRTLMLLNHLLGHLVFCSDPFDVSRMNHEQQSILGSFFPWPSTPDIPSTPHEIVRVLQPIPTLKDLYMIQIRAGKNGEHTYIVVTNLSSRKQHVHLSVMEQIVANENNELVGTEGGFSPAQASAIYFEAQTGQFGLSAAAYMIKPRETCVFLRVIDSTGQLCGPCAALVRAGYNPSLLEGVEVETPVQMVATSGGHALPMMEIESFEQYAMEQERLTVRFRPVYFPKTVTVWLAWKSSKKDRNTEEKALVLNGQPLRLRPEIGFGSGMCLASCSISLASS